VSLEQIKTRPERLARTTPRARAFLPRLFGFFFRADAMELHPDAAYAVCADRDVLWGNNGL